MTNTVRTTISPGETERIITSGQAREVNTTEELDGFDIEIADSPVSFGHFKDSARNGRAYKSGREGRIDPKGEELYAYNDGSEDAVVYVEPAGFEFTLFPPIEISQTQTVANIENIETIEEPYLNRPGIIGDTINPDSTGQTFADKDVPNGFTVVVQNAPANSDTVRIADNGGTGRHYLKPGGTFSVSVENLNQIEVIGTANNPEVNATVEA